LQALGDIDFVEPLDFVFLAPAFGFQALRQDKLNGARAIFTDMGDQGERVAGGYLEFRGPAVQHMLIVRQKSPQECPNDRGSVLLGGERHRERKRIGIL
jgi:hypothetical protein